MKNIRHSRFFSTIISFALLVAPLPLSAITEEIMFDLSDAEIEALCDSQDSLYVYLGKELSDLGNVLSSIQKLDSNKNSLLYELDTYVTSGFSLAPYEAVLEILEYAETVLENNYNKGDADQLEQLAYDFEHVSNKVINGALNVEVQLLETAHHDDNEITRGLRLLIVDENMEVLGKTTLKKHLHTKEGAHIQGKLKVDKNATFKSNVKVKGTLSAADAIIDSLFVTDLIVASCMDSLCVNNLSVGDLSVDMLSINDAIIANATITNLSATDAIVQDLTVVNCMTSLCVNNLSVVDESVSGTLSVNDAVIDNATITNLSATDAVLQDLTVVNCMSSLCVNNLSVVDESISGTLSANDAFIVNATIQNLNVTATVLDSVINNLTVLSTLSDNDALITNATITNLSATDAVIQSLTVTNCMASLCVNSLSVTDESISGTLSANNAVIQNIMFNGTVSATDIVVDDVQATDASIVDATITGTLSVNDEIVANSSIANLSVADEIVTNSSIASLSAADAVIQNLQVTNDSVVDETVTGTLSVNNEIVQNSLIINFSATDATIQNLTVTNCMPNLCVTQLSVVNEVLSGNLQLTALTPAGVLHNDASGNITSSLIVDADITASTITNDKLADISSTNTPGDIVVRDGLGNFETNMITLDGTTTNPTDAATKAYVDDAVSTGLIVHTPAVVVGTSDIGSPPAGLLTIDGVTLVANDRVLLVAQANPVYNGIWLAQSGAWTYPTDFASGTTAGQAYVLILSGTVYGGSSWLCNTPTAVIGTDPIEFAEFSLPDTTTGNNVGAGTGLIFQSKTGNLINFKTLIAGSHIIITNNANDITLATDAVNTNTANTIVARNASGNFSAGTITATLSGNATTATTATNFSGSLSGNVTGTQSATVVSTVGGQTAANVATATVLANAATSADTASTIVLRNASGNFSAGTISITDAVISTNLTLTTTPSTSTAGNILKGTSSFIHNTGTSNTFVGIGAGNFTTSGTGLNSGLGTNALTAITTGAANTAIGTNALPANTIGTNNTAVGTQSLQSNTTGGNNTAIGVNALELNTVGSSNVAIGFLALNANTTSQNTAIGMEALQNVTTGGNNTAIGFQAGSGLTTGSGNIFIGEGVTTSVASISNAILIGATGGTPASNIIAIGNTNTTNCNVQGIYSTVVGPTHSTVIVDNTGNLGTTSSSARFKHNIQDMDDDSAKLFNLRTVTFAYNNDATETKQYGLIAEEVAQVLPELVLHDTHGMPFTVRYELLPVLLVKEVQKQQAIIENLNATVDALCITNEQMNAAINALQNQVKEFIKRL